VLGRTGAGAALVVAFLAWAVAFTLLVVVIGEDFEPSDKLSLAVRARAFSIITFSGLEGFRAVTGRDMTESCCCGFPGEWGFPGEVNKGDCGKVLELDDFGDKILISASRITWETARDWAPVAFGLLRFLGLSRGMYALPAVGAFSLSEKRPGSLTIC
jgi:hypothetical protein